MKDDFGKWIFETLTGRLKEEYKLPGVENAYADGAYCMEQYHKLREAYDSLCQRLGEDEDEDREEGTMSEKPPLLGEVAARQRRRRGLPSQSPTVTAPPEGGAFCMGRR